MINRIDFLCDTKENDFKMWLKQNLLNYVPQKVRHYKNDLKNNMIQNNHNENDGR